MCTYNTPFNTVGVGDPVPYGTNSLGSGDRFDLGPKSNSGFTSRGRSYSQFNYKPAKMTFKPPKQMAMSGIPRMSRTPKPMPMPRMPHQPKPPRFGAPPPPPPPPPMPLPRMSTMPFMKKPATTPGKVSGLKPKPLLVMATKRKKKK